MGTGAHGDLFPVRYLKVDTPVNWIESNEPLQDLEANILVTDGKLAAVMATTATLVATAGTGVDSRWIDGSYDIAAVTAPTAVTTGTRSRALRHPDAVTTGQFIEFVIPDNYVSGDLEVFIISRTASAVASPNNVVRLRTDGELFDVSGNAVTAIASADATITVGDNTTGPSTSVAHTMAGGSFEVGDRVQIGIQRLGGDVADLLGDDLDVMTYGISYRTQ